MLPGGVVHDQYLVLNNQLFPLQTGEASLLIPRTRRRKVFHALCGPITAMRKGISGSCLPT
jgi:hypothetical protein